MQVCCLWWSEGHKQLWRHARLSDLYTHIKEADRRAYFSRYIKTVTLQLGDTMLASRQMALQPVVLECLESVNMHKSNLVNVEVANIESLIRPSLRSVTIKGGWSPGPRPTDRDIVVLLDTLLSSCNTLTTLDLDIDYSNTVGLVLRGLLATLTAIEHLKLGEVADFLHSSMPGQDFLRLLLSKPRLVTLDFPHGADFNDHDVQPFLTGMSADWSLPSLRSLSRPVFFDHQAAISLLRRLPNLEILELELEDYHGDWTDDLEHTFDALSQLKHLKVLEVQVAVNECNLHGSWLVKLTALRELECLSLLFDKQPEIFLTGAQLLTLLTGLPRLHYLDLPLRGFELSCSVDEKIAIEAALARIYEVGISDFIITTQHVI